MYVVMLLTVKERLIMFREVYYVHPKVLYGDDHPKAGYGLRRIAFFTKRILRRLSVLFVFLAVKGCLMVFDGLCRGLDFAVFGKLSLFYGALRVKICASAGVDQVVLVLKRVDGVGFHE